MLLLLQVDITLNTQNNNIINITNEKHSCCSDAEQNGTLCAYLQKKKNIEYSFHCAFVHFCYYQHSTDFKIIIMHVTRRHITEYINYN